MEFSVLRKRLARRLEFEGHTDASLAGLDLVELTKVSAPSTPQSVSCIPARLNGL